VALICAAAPQVALAGSLLSGYGGPGEGSQALVGAALVNGPRGGGGGSSTGGGSPELAEPSSTSASASAPGTTEGRSSSASHGSSRRPSGSSSHHGSSDSRSTSSSGSTTGSAEQGRSGFASYPRIEHVVDAPASFAFGLSGADFVYALVALACLLLAAFATMHLARRPGRTGV
jgi:hypothetical protein